MAEPASPMFPLGVRPRPPIKPAHKSLKISPYKLGITKTSNWLGFWTIFLDFLNKIKLFRKVLFKIDPNL